MSDRNIVSRDAYETIDLDIASFSISEGHSTLVRVKTDGRKRYLALSPVPDDVVVAGFVNNQIKVLPIRLFDIGRRLVDAANDRRVQSVC